MSAGGVINVEHHVYQGEFHQLAQDDSGEWRSYFGETLVAKGSLEQVIKESNMHVCEISRKRKIESLQKQLERSWASEGGNWRRHRREFALSRRIEKLKELCTKD